MMMRRLCLLVCFLPVFAVFAQSSYHSADYDDSTLQGQGSYTLMPYNRMVKSAGTVVTFGEPSQENHALDVALMPDSQHLVIEERYGIQVLDVRTQQLAAHWGLGSDAATRGWMSTYSGIKSFVFSGHTYIVWGADREEQGAIMVAEWDGKAIGSVTRIAVTAVRPAAAPLPNDIAVRFEEGVPYLYVVLNGNDQLLKIRFSDRQVVWSAATGVAPFGVHVSGDKVYVTNWAGEQVRDSSREWAGTPWGKAYTDPVTGATARGTLSVFDARSGSVLGEVTLGLHPNAIVGSPDGAYLYIANGNSDYISVFDVLSGVVKDSIPVGLFSGSITFYGSSPNALAIDRDGETLYVANGMDNAVCVVELGGRKVLGYIPTEAYPGGLALFDGTLYVANIEAKGSRVLGASKAYNVHQELASVSLIPLPGRRRLRSYTKAVRQQGLTFRLSVTNRLPRRGIAPRPVPERIGEPSVFKHVVYIIKENKTYDQVFGDMPQGRGMASLCVYGDSVTPNQHRLAGAFSLLDNYYAAGKCSAEGHQWADAAMVSDYVEKNVRAWFRSYPHRQTDALVYNKNGFIWNNALDHGLGVRVYGEACTTVYDHSLRWNDIYQRYLKQEDQGFVNRTTIGRIRPVISPGYPDCDNLVFTDQIRASIFIDDWRKAERAVGDSLPDLMVLSLPNDHTAGTSPDFPVPRAMVADNDLAVGRIIDVITHSRFWDSTVVFITEDDSQSGWDHISSYRTTGLVISPYSVMGKAIHTNYNQTGMVRTIEQILGLPPMNVIDATALPLFDCFGTRRSDFVFTHSASKIPLDKMNRPLSVLSGKAAYYAKLSASRAFKDVDGGEDDLMNRILWFDAKGEAAYPRR